MLTKNEKEKLIKDAANIFVAAGGIITLAFAIYFIVAIFKKMALIEVEINKYVIKFEDGKSVTVSANNLEEAIDRFKELRIETATKEIRVMSFYDLYNRHKAKE